MANPVSNIPVATPNGAGTTPNPITGNNTATNIPAVGQTAIQIAQNTQPGQTQGQTSQTNLDAQAISNKYNYAKNLLQDVQNGKYGDVNSPQVQKVLQQYQGQLNNLGTQYKGLNQGGQNNTQPVNNENISQNNQPVQNQGNQNVNKTTQPVVKGGNVPGGNQPVVNGQTTTTQSQNQGNKPIVNGQTTTTQSQNQGNQPVLGNNKWGYGTTLEQRDSRNNSIAQTLLNNPNFQWDDNQVSNEIKNEAQMQGTVINDADLTNTVNAIKGKYDTLKQGTTLNNTSDDQILGGLQNGMVKLGDLESLKQINPDKYNNLITQYNKQTQLGQFDKQLNGESTVKGNNNNQPATTLDKFMNMYQSMFDLQNTQNKNMQGMYTDYNDKINSQEMQDLRQSVSDKQTQLDQIDETMAKTKQQIYTKYSNTDMPQSQLDAMVSDATYKEQSQRDSLAIELNASNRTLQTKQATIDSQFQNKLAIAKLQQDDTTNKMKSFMDMYSIYDSEQKRQDQFKILTQQENFQGQQTQTALDNYFKQQKYDYTLKYGDITSSDPLIQKQAVNNSVQNIMDQFKGWTFSRTKDQMVGDVLGLVKGGMSLGDAIQKSMTGQLQSNPQFKNWVQMQTNKTSTDYIQSETVNQLTGEKTVTLINKYDPTDVHTIKTGNVYGGDTTTSGGTLQDMTTTLVRPQGSTNVGQDTNNPGNIMADSSQAQQYASSLGAVGFYKSSNGRTYAVFPDMKTGQDAMTQDIQSKLNGGSSWVKPTTTLAQFATGWTQGPKGQANQNIINNYVKATGFPANTPISQIPQDKLIQAVIQGEGVNVTKSNNIPTITSTQDNTDTSHFMKSIAVENYLNSPTKQNQIMAMQSLQAQGIPDFNNKLNKYKEQSALVNGVSEDTYSKLKNMNLSTDDMSIAQQVANFQADPNKLDSLKNDKRIALYNAALKLNPNATQQNLQRFMQLQDQSSSDYKSYQGANTAIGHLAGLNQLVETLPGQSEEYKVNQIMNWYRKNVGSVPYTEMQTLLGVISPELAKTYKPTTTDAEIESFAKTFDPNYSIPQMKAATQTQIQLLSTKIRGIAQGFNTNGKIPDQVLNTLYQEPTRKDLQSLGFTVNPDGSLNSQDDTVKNLTDMFNGVKDVFSNYFNNYTKKSGGTDQLVQQFK